MSNLCDTNSEKFRSNWWFHYLCQTQTHPIGSPFLLLRPCTCPLEVAPMQYLAIDSSLPATNSHDDVIPRIPMMSNPANDLKFSKNKRCCGWLTQDSHENRCKSKRCCGLVPQVEKTPPIRNVLAPKMLHLIVTLLRITVRRTRRFHCFSFPVLLFIYFFEETW